MGGDLVSWIFHSPRRLVVVAAVVLLAALGLGGLLSRLSGNGSTGGTGGTGEVAAATSTRAGPTATPTAAAGQPGTEVSTAPGGGPSGTPVAGVSGAQAPDAAPFVTAAVRFTKAWGRLLPGETAAQWHERVDPLATAELAAALQLTDPAALPDAAPAGTATVRYLAETSALVAVPLSNGSTVLVTVVGQGNRWQVSDIQPDVGDAGDVDGRQQASATATDPGGSPTRTRPPTTGATP